MNQKIRLSYVSPNDLEIQNDKLYKIDSIANAGIENKAMPGQIIAAKNGHVFIKNHLEIILMIVFQRK